MIEKTLNIVQLTGILGDLNIDSSLIH